MIYLFIIAKQMCVERFFSDNVLNFRHPKLIIFSLQKKNKCANYATELDHFDNDVQITVHEFYKKGEYFTSIKIYLYW